MGLFLSKIMQSLSSLGTTQARILMLGLDAAGKTTILYKFKLNETVQSIPTIGFNVETVAPVKNVSFTVWDVGGQDKIRPLWRHYFNGSDGLIFIVDSADKERLPEAKNELHSILEDAEMANVPVVVFANKQDLPGAENPANLVRELGLETLKGHNWFIQATSATTGEGLYEGVDALAKLVKEYKSGK
eukprot:TRINITY_DN4878_c0_g2_i1.p1 TRINITY_DN4878_c0_g2~~TRINITY_DN4878_c0_g2_i1.p1  ORF type:complete len:188 (+),score=31.83 TRINITY_DN4878_c0_g2_i1:84-647(+)